MATTTLPALQARSRRTLERLVHAAIEVLDEDGIERATIPRIAARAGLTPGAIYRRFPDKDALLREVCLRVLANNHQRSLALLEADAWRDKPLAAICRAVVEQTLRGHARHRGLLRAFTSFLLQHPDPSFVRACEELQWKTFTAVSAVLLARRREIGHPDPESAVRFALLMVGTAAKGVLVLPRDVRHLSSLLPHVDQRLHQELPEMVLRYLDVRPR
jgi:AcrR family transcriptional regulator